METLNRIALPMINGNDACIDLSSTALVLNEFQKQWTERGLYHKLIKNQLLSRNVMPNTLKLVNAWRKKGLPIIHAPIITDPKNKKGVLANISNAAFFTKGTWKSEFSDGMYVQGDPIVEGRYTFNVFENSNFDAILKSKGITTFLICGFTTSLCIKITIEQALKRGYNCVIINDCSATFTGFLQKQFDKKFNTIITTSNKVIETLDTI